MKPTVKNLIIIFSGVFPICMVAFTQTDSVSKPSCDEMRDAAFKSDKAYIAAEGYPHPLPSRPFGVVEYDIPPKYWTDAIKELKPVKVYGRALNVAIVLSIRDDVEEGIYILNPISSDWAEAAGFNFEGWNGPILNCRHYRRTRSEQSQNKPSIYQTKSN